MVVNLLARRPNLNTAANPTSPWLFPGQSAGSHLAPSTLRTRALEMGINLLGARNGALRQLVLDCPPSVVATCSATATTPWIATPYEQVRRGAPTPRCARKSQRESAAQTTASLKKGFSLSIPDEVELVGIDVLDAVQLAELCLHLNDWIAGAPDTVVASLVAFGGDDAEDLLINELDHFADLLARLVPTVSSDEVRLERRRPHGTL